MAGCGRVSRLAVLLAAREPVERQVHTGSREADYGYYQRRILPHWIESEYPDNSGSCTGERKTGCYCVSQLPRLECDRHPDASQ